MAEELEVMRKQLDALELKLKHSSKHSSEHESTEQKKEKKTRTPRVRTAYQDHMSKRLNEMKEEATKNGHEYDRKKAFSEAAREWSGKKNTDNSLFGNI